MPALLEIFTPVQVQNFLDKLRAGNVGELDDFDEQELMEFSAVGDSTQCDYGSIVAGLATQREEMARSRRDQWSGQPGRQELEYFRQLYWNTYCY